MNFKRIIFVFFIVFSVQIVQAQLVNIEIKRKSKDKPLQGNIGISLYLKENTKQIFQAKNNIAFQYAKNAHTFLLLNDLSYMKVQEQDALINSGFQHLRYNYTLKEGKSRLTLEAFAQHQYNQVKLLKIRFISGGGPRFRLLGSDTTNFYLYVCPLFMYEYESLIDDSDAKNDDLETKKIKGDFYISAGYNFNSIISINHVTYYQPELRNWSDYRISSDTGLNIKLTDKLSFSVIFNFDYDAHPPENTDGESLIPDLFYSLTNRISYSF